jgi:hypothetical protein
LGGEEMATFDLQKIECLNQTEPFADELYLVVTRSDGTAVSRYELGNFERDDNIAFPSPNRPDAYFGFNETLNVTIWEEDGIGDDKIGSFNIDPNDPGKNMVIPFNDFEDSDAHYVVTYDIF